MTDLKVSLLLKRGQRCFKLTWNENYRPANDDKVVFPTSIVEAHGGGLEENERSCPWLVDPIQQYESCELTSKLAKQ
jgi:hypothetical protein